MWEQFRQFVVVLYEEIPAKMYLYLTILFCIGFMLAIFNKGIRQRRKLLGLLAMSEYVFLIFCSTVIYRDASNNVAGYNLLPFWSYRSYMSGENPQLLAENIMNVLVFMPVGILLGTTFKLVKSWHVLLTGAGLSVSIEVLQFFLHRGFSEFDDVFHNTLGCVIGFGVITIFFRNRNRVTDGNSSFCKV